MLGYSFSFNRHPYPIAVGDSHAKLCFAQNDATRFVVTLRKRRQPPPRHSERVYLSSHPHLVTLRERKPTAPCPSL